MSRSCDNFFNSVKPVLALRIVVESALYKDALRLHNANTHQAVKGSLDAGE